MKEKIVSHNPHYTEYILVSASHPPFYPRDATVLQTALLNQTLQTFSSFLRWLFLFLMGALSIGRSSYLSLKLIFKWPKLQILKLDFITFSPSYDSIYKTSKIRR